MTHKKYEEQINSDLKYLKKQSKKDYHYAEKYLKKAKDKIHKLRNR